MVALRPHTPKHIRAAGHIVLPANQLMVMGLKIWSLSNPGFEPATFRSLAQHAHQPVYEQFWGKSTWLSRTLCNVLITKVQLWLHGGFTGLSINSHIKIIINTDQQCFRDWPWPLLKWLCGTENRLCSNHVKVVNVYIRSNHACILKRCMEVC
jgi:hypothetical protein